MKENNTEEKNWKYNLIRTTDEEYIGVLIAAGSIILYSTIKIMYNNFSPEILKTANGLVEIISKTMFY